MFKGKTNSSDTPQTTGRRPPGRFRNHKRLTAVGVLAVLAVAGGAYAFWTGTGSGGGSATVGTSGTVTVVATVPDGIAPGTSEPVSFTAGNTSTSPITVTGVHLTGVTVDAPHSTCVTADFTMADVVEAPVGFGHPVPAGATVEALPTNGSLVYANTGVNQDACKGATLTLALTTS
jgi:hypothetical protein